MGRRQIKRLVSSEKRKMLLQITSRKSRIESSEIKFPVEPKLSSKCPENGVELTKNQCKSNINSNNEFPFVVSPDLHKSSPQFLSTDDSITVENIFSATVNFDREDSMFTHRHQNMLKTDIVEWIKKHNFSQNAVNDLLQIFTRNGLTDFPKTYRTLMSTPRYLEIIPMPPGHFYNFGLENVIREYFTNNTDKKLSDLRINVNVDGLPLFASSSLEFWPILISIISKSFCSKPLTVSIYCGNKKPDIDEFLKAFVDECVHLFREGFTFKHDTYKIEFNALICDAPAKAYILCVKGHNGFFGCGKCVTKGVYLNRTMTFPETNKSLRTDKDFGNYLYKDHQKRLSPLSTLNIGLVTCVPFDYMHLVCIGVVKKLLKFWLRGSREVRLTEENKQKFNDVLSNFRKSIPIEFARLPRPLEEIDRWKATELRQIVCYSGCLLNQVLYDDQFKHFMVLFIAIRILCSSEYCISLNNFAKSLLVNFVQNYGILYGRDNITYNVHGLIHLADDVLKFGPLDNFSAFMFENHLGYLKKNVQCGNNPLQQIVNRLKEKSYPKNNNISYPVLSGEHTSGPVLEAKFHFIYYKEVRTRNFTLKISHPNNCCILKNNQIVLVKNIRVSNSEIDLLCECFNKIEFVFDHPCNSNIVGIYQASDLSQVVTSVPLSVVALKAICYHLPHYSVIISLLHNNEKEQ